MRNLNDRTTNEIGANITTVFIDKTCMDVDW